ncbi:DUF3592 domain-containing protein [Streptomyces sp. NPDC059985]|uniref:DUF3592 domain-containing protein n=1 Tax=Streptomyces sp. NPDC059985 TaxID=3347025 RepID=UPI0036CDE270
MSRLPLVVPALILVLCVAASGRAVVRLRRLNSAWSGGTELAGRCVDGRVVVRRRDGRRIRTHHHVYEFVTPDGRTHRFEEAGGPPTTVPGAAVTIRHPEGRPDRATALPPSRGRAVTALVLVFVLSALLGSAAIAFAVHYETRVVERVRGLLDPGPTVDPSGHLVQPERELEFQGPVG